MVRRAIATSSSQGGHPRQATGRSTPAQGGAPAREATQGAPPVTPVQEGQPARIDTQDKVQVSDEAREAVASANATVPGNPGAGVVNPKDGTQAAESPNAVDALAASDPSKPEDPGQVGSSGGADDERDKSVHGLTDQLAQVRGEVQAVRQGDGPVEALGNANGGPSPAQEVVRLTGTNTKQGDPNPTLIREVANARREKAGGLGEVQEASLASMVDAMTADDPSVGHSAGRDGQGEATRQPGNDGDGAMSRLFRDYQDFHSKGAKIRPDVEQMVQETLGGGVGA